MFWSYDNYNTMYKCHCNYHMSLSRQPESKQGKWKRTDNIWGPTAYGAKNCPSTVPEEENVSPAAATANSRVLKEREATSVSSQRAENVSGRVLCSLLYWNKVLVLRPRESVSMFNSWEPKEQEKNITGAPWIWLRAKTAAGVTRGEDGWSVHATHGFCVYTSSSVNKWIVYFVASDDSTNSQ